MACDVNTYRETASISINNCSLCPTGYSTQNKKSQSSCFKNPGLTARDCGASQFLNNKNAIQSNESDINASASSTCEECPRGGFCKGLTDWSDVTSPAKTSKIRSLFGWSRCSRTGAMSVDHMFERCPFAAACLGAPNIALADKFEGNVAMKDREEGCNEAYRNVSHNFLCFGCASGYSHTSGDSSGKCDKCPRPGENEGIAALGVLIGIAGLCLYIKITLGGGGSKDASDGVKSIGLSFVQIISLLTTFPIAWPPMFTALFQIGGAVTVLGQHLVNLKCMFPERSEAEVFYSSQIAWAMVPIGLSGACVATWCLVDCLGNSFRGCISRCKSVCVGEPQPQPTATEEEEVEEEGQRQRQQAQITLRQKIAASVVALLYLVWPGLCSETFGLFACRSSCGDTARSRLRVDLDEICFQGRHANFAFLLGVPMLILYVIGLPFGALVMVWRLHRRAERNDVAVHECKGHLTWGLFYTAFREDTWWWEGTVALRKIGIAMIGVFGIAMEEMQVSLTLVLVFLVILLTAVRRPYGENSTGKLLQRLELSTLCLLYLTLWTASVFTLYPRCEIREGESVWWCELMSVIIGLADVIMVILIILLFVWLKGTECTGGCANRCIRSLPGSIRRASYRVHQKVMLEWDMRHGGEAAVQARVRARTVENERKLTEVDSMQTMVDNPVGNDRDGTASSSSRRFKKVVHRIKQANLVIRAMEKTRSVTAVPNDFFEHASTVMWKDVKNRHDSPVVTILVDESSGRRYSYNRETSVSEWLEDEEDDGSDGEIQILQADDGRKYSFDPVTKVTNWL
jgi:hypothetical protein